jgi:hypothetical protein
VVMVLLHVCGRHGEVFAHFVVPPSRVADPAR